MTKLTRQECLGLASHLGDTPMTLISTSRLKQGGCDAYIADSLSKIKAALVFDPFCPEEPCGFGPDTDMLWQLLKSTQGWECVNVDIACAEPLAKRIQAETETAIRYYGDVYHALLTPVRCYSNAVVRVLTPADAECLAQAPAEVRGSGYQTPEAMVTEGIAAGTFVAGNLVAIAHTYAETDLHADIGVSTIAQWRGKGFATAAASCVAQAIQVKGKVPVWSCGEDNQASLRVAEKLGFTEVGRRVYLIPTTSE